MRDINYELRKDNKKRTPNKRTIEAITNIEQAKNLIEINNIDAYFKQIVFNAQMS